MDYEVGFVTPENHFTAPLPTYPEIRLAVFPGRRLRRELDNFAPDAIHIATEGPLGLSARRFCLRCGRAFSTAFHTRFPEYIRARFPFIPEIAVYKALRAFHKPATSIMVSTPSLKRELESRGFAHVALWSRGVDAAHFKPGPKDGFTTLGLNISRPVFLYVGRLSVEKNLDAFLGLDLPGSKVVIGDGPQRHELMTRFPDAYFLGVRTGHLLAKLYAASDVFVFPSRTDTFGLVMLEALSSGLPVAAFPAQAPKDIVGGAPVAVLDEDLRSACLNALNIRSEDARAFANGYSWRASTEQFLANLAVDGV
jgi:glycosyltransferase involved in cell wall biosynthesis